MFVPTLKLVCNQPLTLFLAPLMPNLHYVLFANTDETTKLVRNKHVTLFVVLCKQQKWFFAKELSFANMMKTQLQYSSSSTGCYTLFANNNKILTKWQNWCKAQIMCRVVCRISQNGFSLYILCSVSPDRKVFRRPQRCFAVAKDEQMKCIFAKKKTVDKGK